MEKASETFPEWVSTEIVDFHAENGIKRLFKWQKELLDNRESNGFEGNVVFSAPTSAGKSLVAELLAWRVAAVGRKVLFVLPYISVARERLHQIQKCWRRVDIPVSAFIGPSATSPKDWTGAVCTIEKAASLTNRALSEGWFNEIGMIVIDELHMIFDSSRGSHIEYMLSKVKFWNRSCTESERIALIGMSATIPQIGIIGDWLNAKIYKADFRPIEIVENVIIGNYMMKIENGQFQKESRVKLEIDEKKDPVMALVERSFRQNCQTLVMCSSKMETEKVATSIAQMMSELRHSDPSLLEIVKKRSVGLIFTKTGLERNGCRDRSLMMTLSWAVAYHHAGLTLEERECIEMGFREKSVIILVATSTLASGVNLPAEKVIIKSQTRGPSAISAMSYRQMIGRVGRMGLAEKGESYLVVRPSDEAKIEKIIFDSSNSLQLEHCSSNSKSAGKKDLSKFILEGVCTSLTKHRADILDLSSSLLFTESQDENNENVVDSSLEKLKTNSFVVEVETKQNEMEISATQLGKATIASSLPPDAALAIFEDLSIASRAIALDTELHMLYLVTPINVTVWQECDWHHLFSIFSKIPPDHRRVAKLVGVNERFILNQMRGCKDDAKLQIHIRFFSALALFDLINEHSIHEVSQKYRISRGCLQTLQSQSSTYADISIRFNLFPTRSDLPGRMKISSSAMIVAFCLRLGWTYLKSLLDGFAMRLFFGIRSELSDLVSIDGIDGQRARILHEKGITCLTHLASCDKDKLAHYLTLAVPYSRSNSNDGKAEWLFGEPRVRLDEAAKILKERAKEGLMNRIKELGLGMEIVNVKQEEVDQMKDSGIGLVENLAIKNEIDRIDDYKVKIEVKQEVEKDTMEEDTTQNLTEAFSMECSIVSDNEDDEDVFLEYVNNEDENDLNKVEKGEVEEVEDESIDCLETSLLKMVPPSEERFFRRLSQTFSPVLKFKSTPKSAVKLKSGDSAFEDSFDRPIPGSIPLIKLNKSRRESIILDDIRTSDYRRESLDASTASENQSFDVFATPPPKDEKPVQVVKDKTLKHSRITYMTNSPLSSFVSSPILKHIKFDQNRFILDDVCSNFESWNEWVKLAKTSSNISVAVMKNMEGIALTTDKTNTVYVPMELEDLDGKVNILKCTIPRLNRFETIKLLLEAEGTEVTILTMRTCFRLFERFGMKIRNPNFISILAHLNHLTNLKTDENDETSWFPTLLDNVTNWDFGISAMYSNYQSEENKIAIESFAMRKIFERMKMLAIEKSTKESVDLEINAVKTVARMFYSGIPFDRLECDSAVKMIRTKVEQLEEECWKLAHGKFNIDSSQHVANVLFCRLGLIYPDATCSKTKKHLDTSKIVLEQMVGQHEIVKKILKYRHVKHTLTKCLLPIQSLDSSRSQNDGRIHCWFEMETATGRILTSSPNIQNVPKRQSLNGLCIRQIFRSKENYSLIGADYSQLELRVLAHLSNDHKLVEMIVQERDVFRDLSEVWGFPRDAVKQLCYGLIYGMGVKSLAELTKMTLEDAEKMRKMFFDSFSRVKSYTCETKEKAFDNGFVETILGRKRVTSRSQVPEERSREERIVVNYTIQGSASEIFKNAIVQIERGLKGLDAQIVMTVHDEVIVETADDVANQAGEVIRVAMESSLRDILRVPMRVSMKVAKTHEMEAAFCIRNFLCEHTQETPGPLDDVAPGRKNKLPVFHIHGVADTGQKACLHIHGVLPYLILRVGGRLTPAVFYAMRAKINRCIQREIESSTGTASRYQSDYVYKMEAITSRPIYGYQEEEEEFVRVYFPSPWYLQKATTALGREVLQKSVFQPFEAHLPFHLQFFIDNSIFGMDNIYLSKVKFRISPMDSDDQMVYKGLIVENIRNQPTILSPLDRQSMCVLECDAHFSDILNVKMHSKNVHSSNPGLEYIWREEKERCDAQGIAMVDVFNSYEPRKSTTWPQEREMLKNARQIAKKLRSARNMPSNLDDIMQTFIADSQVSGPSEPLNATFWEDDDENSMDRSMEVDDGGPERQDESENRDDNENENEQDQEFEMSQKVASETDSGRQEQVEKPKQPKKPDVIEIEDSDDDEHKKPVEKLEWITPRSAFRQKFIEYGKDENQSEEPGVRKPFSREMTSCSVLTNDTIMRLGESQTMEPSKFLTQISMEETIDESEKSGESDIVGLCTASLELLVQTSKPMPDVVNDPIICASIAIFDDVCRESCPKCHLLLTTISIPSSFDKRLEIYDSEAEIMERIAELIVKFDVDVMVGYDTTRLSWGYFLKRSSVVGVKLMMDRLKMTESDENRGQNQAQNINPYQRVLADDEEALPATPKGRLLVAVWRVVKSDLTLRSYDLGTAVSQVLRRKISMLDNCTLTKRIETADPVMCSDVFTHLLKLSRVNISLLMEMNWFLKNAEMARVYGIQFHEVWTRGSQLRVESMLLRLAKKMNFLAPSVTQMQRNLMSAPEQLQLILEPQSKVYYDPVIVLDFQSLYPSMVIAYNYCYSTILGKITHLQQFYDDNANFEEIVLGAMKYQTNKETLVKLIAYKEVVASPLASLFVKKSTREGVLPTLLREILSARIMVKNAMKRAKSKKLKRILDARQLALKLVANVSYGYTAANWSGRMPCAELADAILGKGRETLERAIEMVQKGSYGGSEVIYGDTDSMFVLVKGATLEQAFEIGRRIASDVTDANPDPVVLKLEKVYKGCVLETKKRYAGWMYESENDIPQLDAKGIETVRRDTAPIVAEVLEKSLEFIFTKKWKMLYSFLNKTTINLPRLNLTKFVFCKEFRGDYSKKAMVPQKKIAEKRSRMCKSYVTLRGERVPYIIVDGPPGSTVYSCVRTIDDYANNSSLRINVNYYLNAHILAALRRVTDLLPMKIEVLSLHSNQCFSSGCTLLGQTPWCIRCQRLEKELATAMVQIGRETRALSGMRQMCRTCQSSTNRLSDSGISECLNYSCLVKQTCTMMVRKNTSNVVKAHKLF